MQCNLFPICSICKFFLLQLEAIGKQLLLIFISSATAYPIWQLSFPPLVSPAATLPSAFSLFRHYHQEGAGEDTFNLIS